MEPKWTKRISQIDPSGLLRIKLECIKVLDIPLIKHIPVDVDWKSIN